MNRKRLVSLALLIGCVAAAMLTLHAQTPPATNRTKGMRDAVRDGLEPLPNIFRIQPRRRRTGSPL